MNKVELMFKQYINRCSTLLATAAAVMLSIPAHAVDLNLSQTPLYLSPAVAPLNMLVVGRDHKLYYEAYNDYTDLNEDGVLDTKYKPTQMDYYGYFDSYKCYTYDNTKFIPSRTTANKTCTGEWSGDFLNYLTTARIDALRKVLYGGYRTTDSDGVTVLERTYIPQDAHSWGKEYTSVAVDGYDLTQYAPLTLPTTDKRHLFANTTPLNTASPLLTLNQPLLRVLTNRDERIWNWVSIERPVAHTQVLNAAGTKINVSPTDYIVKVSVCVAGMLESNCRAYTGNNNTTSFKPIGLLQEFGENDAMLFGLITGSYAKNTSGGVLRREMSSITREINTNGTFKNTGDGVGVIATLNRMRVTGFNYINAPGYQYTCGFDAAARPITEGECQMWGNPIAEMMYEGLRYFAGKGRATGAYSISFAAGEESQLQQTNGGLPVAGWDNPYTNRPYCSKPFQTVVSDINPSYDTDQLPGTAFGNFNGNDVSGLDVSTLGQKIWNGEFGSGTTQNVFIGQVAGGTNDGAPTAKSVSSFGNIRGLSPEEPTKRGGYYAASVAHYGAITDINAATGDQKMQTFSVALASPLPKIEIPIGNGKISLVPFAKSVNGSGIDRTGTFQPTDQIVDFYVDTLTDTYGRFRVNFEDVEQGADHDMDAITIYEYTVNANNTVTVTLTSEYAFGGITQHMGYVISGTTRDGTYLEVLDKRDGHNINDPGTYNDVDYRLDTPPAFTGTPPAPNTGAGRWNDGQWLPYTTSRTFSAGSTPGATTLKDPLWYAAKWGGFQDGNGNGIPDVRGEWDDDATGTRGAGTPDNYFLVTNALKLSEQLREAFTEIIARSSSAASVALSGGAISSDTRVFQAKFDTAQWTGQLLAFSLNVPPGTVNPTPVWDASDPDVLPGASARTIFTVNSEVPAPVAFRYDQLDNTRKLQLADTAAVQQVYVNYLRGDGSQEGTGTTYQLRERDTKLGDIVSSAPIYVGMPRAGYPDNFEGGSGYQSFVDAMETRPEMVYVGANDGMVHGFDADTGVERMAFIPGAVFGNLKFLTDPDYAHRYYVDGAPNAADVFFNRAWHTVLVGGLNLGGQSIYALDVTRPGTFSEGSPNNVYLWEFTDRNDPDLGYTYSQPAIVYMQNGKWAAVFGNGYNNTAADGVASATGNAVLYIVDIQTGQLIRKLDTGVGMAADPTAASRPNGLATPVLVDVDGDRVVDSAYVGDLFGNMWKVDLSSDDASDWGFAFGNNVNPQPFFVAVDAAGNRQPITVRPEVARGPNGSGIVVVFGTGKYLEESDKTITPQRTQTFYGLVDYNNGDTLDQIGGRTDLTRQTIDAEVTITRRDGTTTLSRETSQVPLGGRGWYLDLISPVSGYQGERSVSDPLVRDERVIFTTLLPNSDPCSFGGKSWFMVLDLLSGGRLTEAQLDTDGDGDVDENDRSSSGTQQDGAGTEANAASCLDANCAGDIALNSDSGGKLNQMILRSYGAARGRQSWRQVR
jgi:type IV pilus assembly protein PilY1